MLAGALSLFADRQKDMSPPPHLLRATPLPAPPPLFMAASISPFHQCQLLLPTRRRCCGARWSTSSPSRPLSATQMGWWGRRGVTCMANPRRVKMVAKQIRRELSDMLLTDKVLQYAVLPEASLGADRYLSSLTTISDVEVSGDLQVVKVYVSVFGDERGREIAIAGLKSKARYVRCELGRRMKLRLTPEVRFIEDESLERGSRVIAILDRLKDGKRNVEDEDEGQSNPSDSPREAENWDDDDMDDGIIYVK